MWIDLIKTNEDFISPLGTDLRICRRGSQIVWPTEYKLEPWEEWERWESEICLTLGQMEPEHVKKYREMIRAQMLFNNTYEVET